MKLTLGKLIVANLIVGSVLGGLFFAFRLPPRHGIGRAMTHSQRPESQLSDFRSAVADENPSGVQEEWSRFRGPNGTGISRDATIPIEWSDTQNLRWKTKLPGPGSSTPVLTAKHVFLTSYTGYG